MDAETLTRAKEELVRRIKEFYGDNLLSIIFYGRHLKDPSFPEIDVVVVIDKPYDPVKLNRIADFVEKVRDPIEEKYGYHVSFELYTREEAENFHSGYLDVVVNYEVAYDKNNYFQNLLRDMLNPEKAMDYVKYISTIEYVPVDREEKE
ncbi:nucleotidyltransferase [Thermococcus gorgonarius]|uniref:Nucleotidyltransferase n=1 Tax=Thermococcus gorgonarius TaxID=71997 RepID=A0A2Z2MBY0_THEGO|nr:nucleotidyltransferase [Thermococcus gorgonarius]ASJ01444.1 nucleotidyltransferase [Thermococcus gorgonarius]